MNTRVAFLIVFGLTLVGTWISFVSRNTRRTPSGQQSLVKLTLDLMPVFRQDFNGSKSMTRVLAFFSPSSDRSIEGAKVLQRALEANPERELKVFVIWQPTSDADKDGPSNATLGIVKDRRVSQFWDLGRAVAAQASGPLKASANPSTIGEDQGRMTVVLDYVAIVAPGIEWGNAFPRPFFAATPVSAQEQALRVALGQ